MQQGSCPSEGARQAACPLAGHRTIRFHVHGLQALWKNQDAFIFHVIFIGSLQCASCTLPRQRFGERVSERVND